MSTPALIRLLTSPSKKAWDYKKPKNPISMLRLLIEQAFLLAYVIASRKFVIGFSQLVLFTDFSSVVKVVLVS